MSNVLKDSIQLGGSMHIHPVSVGAAEGCFLRERAQKLWHLP